MKKSWTNYTCSSDLVGWHSQHHHHRLGKYSSWQNTGWICYRSRVYQSATIWLKLLISNTVFTRKRRTALWSAKNAWKRIPCNVLQLPHWIWPLQGLWKLTTITPKNYWGWRQSWGKETDHGGGRSGHWAAVRGPRQYIYFYEPFSRLTRHVAEGAYKLYSSVHMSPNS